MKPTLGQRSGENITIEDIFIHKNRLCMIIKMSGKNIISDLYPYHNGYVQVSKKNINKSYDKFVGKIRADELTFGGTFTFISGIYFFGFDSAHSWNNPNNNNFESVKKRTIALCNEMVRKRI
jgi:hypothetical protein